MKIGCKIRVSRVKPLEQAIPGTPCSKGLYLTWRNRQNCFFIFSWKRCKAHSCCWGETPIRSHNVPSSYTRHVQLYGTGKLNTRKRAITFRMFRLLTARTSHGRDKGFYSSPYIYVSPDILQWPLGKDALIKRW
jgi:hypothetical protein